MSYPSPPPADRPVSTTAGPAPSSVRTAALLVYGLVAIGVIRTIAAIAAKDTLIDAYVNKDGDSGVNTELAREGAPTYVPIAIISLVIFGGLLLLWPTSSPRERAGRGSLPSSSASWVPSVVS